MTVYEWKITDLDDGQFGYIWIKRDKDEFGTFYRIYVDLKNLAAWVLKALPDDAMTDDDSWMEVGEDCGFYRKIIFLWRSKRSPVINQQIAGYEAPSFPLTDFLPYGDQSRSGVNAKSVLASSASLSILGQCGGCKDMHRGIADLAEANPEWGDHELAENTGCNLTIVRQARTRHLPWKREIA